MDRIEYRFVDKATWDKGPWTDEPDKIQWQDEETSLPCLVRRGPFGQWCGYVGVAEGHPLFGKDYHDVSLNVHGGITFTDMCHDDSEHHGVCHIPGKGEPDHVWWFGFDCGHYGDYLPNDSMISANFRVAMMGNTTYRDLNYVTNQVRILAKQLKEIEDEAIKSR